MADLSRYDDWIAWLTERAASDPDVLAAWVGGSAATGGWDEWSDLDLDVLCTPGTSTAVYRRWLVGASDPDGRIVLEEEDVGAGIAAALAQARQRRSTDEWLVNRALARGHPAEVVDFYVRFALATLVRLVRVEHCPWRHDFGLRYLRDDLPADVVDRLEALVPGLSPRSLRELSGLTFAWIDELLA